ncbi:unnamed protein product, partial [Allacma fusca]
MAWDFKWSDSGSMSIHSNQAKVLLSVYTGPNLLLHLGLRL